MASNTENIPMAVLKSWPEPNFVDPTNRTWSIPCAAVLQAVTTLFLGVRLYLRGTKQAGRFGYDDAILILGYMGASTYTTLNIIAVEHYGLGLHVWDLSVPRYTGLAFMGFLHEMVFFIAATCVKVSILLFYRRLAEDTVSTAWKFAIVATIVFVICTGMATLLVICLTCRPTEAYWKAYELWYPTEYTCVNATTVNLVNGVLSVLGDLASVLLPLGMLWNIAASRGRRIALNAMCSLGLFIIAAGSLRTYYYYKFGTTDDLSGNFYNVAFWALMELQLGIMCASAPQMRVLCRVYLHDHLARGLKALRRPMTNRMPTAGPFDLDDDAIQLHGVQSKGQPQDKSGRGRRKARPDSVRWTLSSLTELG